MIPFYFALCFTAPDLDPNQFENGRLELTPVTKILDVVMNSPNGVTMRNSTANDIKIPSNSSFEIVSQSGASSIGTIQNSQTVTPNQTVTVITYNAPFVANAYQGGQIWIIPFKTSLTVTANTANSVNVVNGNSQIVVTGDTRFRLYDDDDYNGDQTPSTLDGDEVEPIAALGDTFAHLSPSRAGGAYPNGSPMNILASAYILPEYDWAQVVKHYNQSNVPFNVNVEDIAVGTYLNYRGSAFDGRDSFWIGYFLISYQGPKTADFDGTANGQQESPIEGVTNVNSLCDCYLSSSCPRPSGICSTFPVGGSSSLIYEESTRDFDKYLNSLPPPANFSIKGTEIVAPHELGHQFGLKGDGKGQTLFFVMDYPTNSDVSRVQFHPEHINIIRKRVKSPGY